MTYVKNPLIGLDETALKLDGTLPIDVQSKTIDPFNRDSEESIFWRVSEKLRNKLDEIPVDLFLMSERDLEIKVKPGDLEDQLRTSFWVEYERMNMLGQKKMVMSHIYEKHCSREYFYAIFLERPHHVAWMLRPTQNYDIRASSLLDLGYRKLSEAMRAPVIDADGNINRKNMDIIMKAVQMLDIRIKGMPMQKVQQTNVNLSYKQGPITSPNQELANIERELMELKSQQALIDVSPNSDG